VAGLLLAAGAGTRLGTPKALLEHGGELFVERGARMLAESGCDPVVVVLGCSAAEVRARARLGRATLVGNEGWEEGIGSSLRAGLAELERSPAPAAPAVVIALADQPFVGREAVARLIEAWRAGAPAAVAAYGGSQQNPVLLDSSLWREVAALARGDVGARAYLKAHPEVVTVVECGDVGSGVDIDTPADLARLDART
jgi:nicotine blue oxidoreductase